MRYYSITLTDPISGQSIVQDGSQGFAKGTGSTFSSFVNGASDPGALNVNFDLPIVNFDAFQGAQRVKIQGVGLKMLGQASNLAGLNFTMKAGMAPNSLPLANPAQAGIVLQGNVFQAYGNWQGVDQTVDLIINPGIRQSIFEVGIPFWWQAGTPLSQAIESALQQALPGFKYEIFIDSRLVLANDENGWYQNFAQFAQYLKGLTLKLGSALYTDYPGVVTAWNGDTISVYDASGGGPPSINVQLNFQDLIGQPTWIGPAEVNFKTVLRADISVGNLVTFPAGIVAPYAITSPSAALPNVPARSSTVFQGQFLVKEVHHFGNFRQPDADSWATSFVGIPVPKANT